MLLGHWMKYFIDFIIGCSLLCLSRSGISSDCVLCMHKGGNRMKKASLSHSVIRCMILCSPIIYERELMLVEELCG